MISPGPYGKYDRRHHQHVGGAANKPDSILAKHRVWLQEGLLWEHAEGGLGQQETYQSICGSRIS
jgi:hypothetical protein